MLTACRLHLRAVKTLENTCCQQDLDSSSDGEGEIPEDTQKLKPDVQIDYILLSSLVLR